MGSNLLRAGRGVYRPHVMHYIELCHRYKERRHPHADNIQSAGTCQPQILLGLCPCPTARLVGPARDWASAQVGKPCSVPGNQENPVRTVFSLGKWEA